jgi:signal transduction histidine kinase
LSIDLINSLFVDESDNVWVGTENGGINLFNREDGNFWHYRKDEYDPQSISNESIEAVCQDKSGNLWFGTYTGGLNIAMKNWDAILKFQNLPGAPLSLSHNTVTCFLEDHKDQIWVGTDGGGLNLFDVNKKRFDRFTIDNSNLGSNSVLCMLENSEKEIWLGTWAGGLIRFDSRTGTFFPLTTKNSGLRDNNIYALAEGFNNDLWLGSFEHGLIHYQIKEKKFTDYTPSNSNIGNEMVVKVLRFSHRRLIIGTTVNLQMFSPDDNRFITYNSDPHNINTLSYPRVTDILVENDTCVWVGTPDGLNCFNPVTGSFKRFYEKDGLPNNFIKAIILDNSGKLWVSTNTGICRYDPKEKNSKNFIKADGLQSNEFYERSALKTRHGELLLGGIKGLNYISPDKITENKTTPDIIITDFKLFNRSVKPGVDNSLLAQNISETRSIILPHGYSVMTFAFAVMDFSAPEKNSYAYMMENFDKDWIYCDNRSEATYTNLSPGNYIFRVKGSNNDGLWNKTGTSVRITILPPWWDTLWFKFVFASSIILMFTIFYLSRVKQLKRQKMFLEETVALKTLELNELNASKDKFFSIIAHDLKNPFSTIIGFSELLKDDVNIGDQTKTRHFANSIHRSAIQTLGLLENLLEWANSQRGKIPFNPGSLRLKDLVNEEFNLVSDMAVDKNIELRSSFPEEMTVFADKDMIKTVLRNLLSNAIKFTHRNGKVELQAAFLNGGVEISVSDTGIGMTNEILTKLFRIDANLSTRGTEDEKGTGLGLFLCKEFVGKHGGKIWAESESGKGSTFRLFLPTPNTSRGWKSS